jgi:hypothetical protein
MRRLAPMPRDGHFATSALPTRTTRQPALLTRATRQFALLTGATRELAC